MTKCNNRLANYEVDTYRPRLDVTEFPEAHELRFDVPGASSFELTVDDGVLSLRAEVADRAPADAKRSLREYGIGAFVRRTRLPDGVDVDGITASYDAGVLTVNVPTKAKAGARTIPISTD